MHLMNYDYEKSRIDNTVGMVKLASIIKDQRNKNKNVLLVDDGDLIQGTAVADYIHSQYKKAHQKVSGHIAYELLSKLHYDVAALGNHEFNYGLDFLNKSLKSANFPVLSANVYHVDAKGNPTTHYFQPSVILDRTLIDTQGHKHKIKIGVIGVVTPEIMNWDRANLLIYLNITLKIILWENFSEIIIACCSYYPYEKINNLFTVSMIYYL